MVTNERLSAALLDASRRSERIEANAKRTRFTTDTATAANEKKYADRQKKPKTATVRVEADVIDLVKIWPTSVRVRYTTEAIRSAVHTYKTLENIKNG